MKITYNVAGLVIEAKNGGASLLGTLKETCIYCGKTDCTCSATSHEAYNDVMDGIESLLLALAAEGVNIARKEFEVAIQTAQDAAANQHS